EAHICNILDREGRPFEQEAAHLIARRAAGSVRDSMSLLGQVLALGCAPGEALTARMAREVLGLAGQEVMDRLLTALATHDTTGITVLVRELLAQGADMGFFLRELGSLWRSLFLLKQAGKSAAQELDLPQSERDRLVDMASRFTLTYIHAAWQMTLDSQRRILTSLEPSAGLELLLLNLAMLPRLLPLEELGGMGGTAPAAQGGTFGAPSVAPKAPPVPPAPQSPPFSARPAGQAAPAFSAPVPAARAVAPAPARAAAPSFPAPAEEAPWDDEVDQALADMDDGLPEPSFVSATPARRAEAAPAFVPPPPRAAEARPAPAFRPPSAAAPQERPFSAPASPRPFSAPRLTESAKTAETPAPKPKRDSAEWKDVPVDTSLTWEDFILACEGKTDIPIPMLRQVSGEVRGDWLVLQPLSQVIGQQLQRAEKVRSLENFAESWAGRPLKLAFRPPQKIVRTEAELKEELNKHPVVKRFQEAYGAMLVRCTPVRR
ncbi:MAG: DNA polymerase III subunit gamma/tau, partial [Mailhella sp.]|nr:DNA polymerase III subunit gamma/tau [Mailhella sp.]